MLRFSGDPRRFAVTQTAVKDHQLPPEEKKNS